MATLAAAKPHPIYLAGRWVDSPDPLVIANPARADEPAGQTFNATEEQYEEAVDAAVAAFDQTRMRPAYERSAALRRISDGIRGRREELGRLIATAGGGAAAGARPAQPRRSQKRRSATRSSRSIGRC